MSRLAQISVVIAVSCCIGGTAQAEDMMAVLDSSNGSSAFVVANAASNALMQVASDGDVGIGVAPNNPLQVKKNCHGAWIVSVHNTGMVPNDYGMIVRADGGDPFLVQTFGGATALRVESDGDVGIGENNPTHDLHVAGSAWCSAGSWSGSDARWKKNIEPIGEALQKALRLEGVTYEWRRDEFEKKRFPEGRHMGLIAQEVEKQFPECVTTDADGYKAIAYDRFSAVLLEAVKSQQTLIERQNKRLDELERKLSALEKEP